MLKKLVLISIVLFAGLIVIITRPFSGLTKSFELREQVEERQLIGVFNMTKLLSDAKEISTKLKTFGLAEQYLTEVSRTMKESGLRLDKVYYSLETRDTLKRSLYFEIIDRAALESTFRNFSNFYDLRQDSTDTSIYIAEENLLAIRIKDDWVEIIQGDLSNLKHQPSLSTTAKQLLKEEHFFAFNPTASPVFDENEFITGEYQYDSIFSLSGQWTCTSSAKHPVQPMSNKISFYKTEEAIIEAFLNVDRKAWGSYDNDFLSSRLERIYKVGMFDYNSLSENWSGQFAFNFGGIQLVEQSRTLTEFDENFNPIERTLIEMDTIRDVGFVFSSNDANALHKELIAQNNIEEKNGKTFIGLLPPLQSKYSPEHLILSVDSGAMRKKSTLGKVLHFQFNSDQLNVSFDAETEGKQLNFNFRVVPQTSEKFKAGDLINVFI